RMVRDVALRLWDRATQKPVRELGQGPYAFIHFSPDAALLAAVRYDGQLDLWDVHAGRRRRGWKVHGHPTTIAWMGLDDHRAGTVACLPAGKPLMTVHPLEGVRFWDVARGAKVRELPHLPQPGDAFALSPDGGLLAIATRPAVYTGKATEQDHGR